MAHGRCEICCADAQKLLPRVQGVSVLGCESASGRDSFDIGQQQTAGGQRNYSLHVTQSEGRARQVGQARRNLSCYWHPKRRKPQQGSGNDRQHDNPERNRFSRQQPFADYDQPERDDADGKNEILHMAELPGQQKRALEKVVTAAFHAEQAWQLGHGYGQARAGLEAHKDAVADQFHQHAQPQQPRKQAERRNSKGSEAGNLRISLHISAGHFPHRSGNHEGNGGSGSDRKLT